MILSGNQVADKVKHQLLDMPIPNGVLAIVQVGNDPVSTLYVRKKQEMADELGVKTEVIYTSACNVLSTIDLLNKDKEVQGIIVQLPLPESLSKEEVLKKIDINKDVDGFYYILGQEFNTYPPTILAIYEMLKQYNTHPNKILIVGSGFLVGKPLKKFLDEKKIDCEILKKDDPDYDKKLKDSDTVVVATGGGRIFNESDFKKGAVVIDASTIADEGKVKGDVVIDKAEFINISPVPGGVGPVTVMMLFKNFFELL